MQLELPSMPALPPASRWPGPGRAARGLALLGLLLLSLPACWPMLQGLGRAAAWAANPESSFAWGGDAGWLGLPGRVQALLGRSFLLSLLSGLMATALGGLVAWAALAPRSRGWRRAMGVLLAAVFCCGSVVHLMAWRVFWPGVSGGAAGWCVAILALGLRHAPISAALLCCGLAALHRAEMEAALCTGGARAVWAVARGRVARLAGMSVAAVAALVFAESELPPLLGVGVFAEEFLSQVALQPTVAAAIAHGWPMMVVALLCGAWLARLPRLRPATAGGRGGGWVGTWPMPSRAMQWASRSAVGLAALPLLLLAAGSVLAVGRWPAGALVALLSSLTLAAAAGVGATLWAHLLVGAASLTGPWAVGLANAAALVMMLWPSSLTGLAISSWTLPQALGDGMPLLLAHMLRALPFAVWLLLALRGAEPLAPREQLATMGAPWWPAWRHVGWPAAAPALGAAFALSAGLSLAELSATVLTVPAGTETVILRLYNLMHYGDQRGVLGLACAQAACVVLLGTVAGWKLARPAHA